ncbi:MAG TPA: hypothetical protein VER77_05370 [Candidatus Dormibacteraeota bacterium]|nr:hypothetical protein [Candidatus Dormibacteraeota bacterium]
MPRRAKLGRGPTAQGRGVPWPPAPPWALIAPAVLALVLVLPTFSFTYLFDDYDFLGRAQSFQLSQLTPDPGTLFYRPLSREIYFRVLYLLDPNQPFWGHLANTILLVAAVLLLSSITRKLAGPRAGYAAGAAFAALGALPILVGWASGSQDLLAIVFVLAALAAQLSNRPVVAMLGMACALLSKETAVAFVPAIAIARWVVGERPYKVRTSLIGFGLLVAAWGAAHPGIRLLLSSGLESGGPSAAYLTWSGADRWASLVKGVATLGNLPISGAGTPWPGERNSTLAVAAAVVLMGSWTIWRFRAGSLDRGTAQGGITSAPRLVALSLLLAIPPLLLISLLVRYWQPYYLSLAAIGTSMLLGVGLARLPALPAAALALGFLALGIWCRGMDLGPGIPTERTVRPPMERLRRAEAEFRKRFPRIDSPAHVYLSVFVPEDKAVSMHLFRFQVLRIWYRNHSIDTMHPEWRRPDPPEERLAWVAPDMSVHEIDPRTLETRPALADSGSYEYGATLRAYAQGLAASGHTDRAVEILLRMPAPDPLVAVVHRRLAAALLLADGREPEAAKLLRTTPPLDREDALDVAGMFLSNPARRDIDAPVLAALGLAPADTAAVRGVMRKVALTGRREATIRFAHRLLAMMPGDWEAEALLRWLRQGAESKRVTVPVVADSLW